MNAVGDRLSLIVLATMPLIWIFDAYFFERLESFESSVDQGRCWEIVNKSLVARPSLIEISKGGFDVAEVQESEGELGVFRIFFDDLSIS